MIMRAAKDDDVGAAGAKVIDGLGNNGMVDGVVFNHFCPAAAIGFQDGDTFGVVFAQLAIALTGKGCRRCADGNNVRFGQSGGRFQHRFDADKFLRWIALA